MVYVNNLGIIKIAAQTKIQNPLNNTDGDWERNTETKATFLGETDETKLHCSWTSQIFLIPCHHDLLHKQDDCFYPNRNIIPICKSTPEHLPVLSPVARKRKLSIPLPPDSVSAAVAQLYCKFSQTPTRAFKFLKTQ